MKIYIELENLYKLSKKIPLLEKYFVKSYLCYEVFSDEGQFIVDNDNIFKIEDFDRMHNYKTYFSKGNYS